nr:hypothetical protein [Tanacetum cinerariifolium]
MLLETLSLTPFDTQLSHAGNPLSYDWLRGRGIDQGLILLVQGLLKIKGYEWMKGERPEGLEGEGRVILSHATRPKLNGFPPRTFNIDGQAFVDRHSSPDFTSDSPPFGSSSDSSLDTSSCLPSDSITVVLSDPVHMNASMFSRTTSSNKPTAPRLLISFLPIMMLYGERHFTIVNFINVVREDIEAFVWTGSERTTVLRFVIEHKLKIYPFAEPIVHKRRPVEPEGRLAPKEKVFRWLGEGLIRKVLHLKWVTNVIPIKLTNGTWKVQMDYFGLNKACTKDIIQPNKYCKRRKRKDWVSYERSILVHPHAKRIKELCYYTSEDDGKGLNQSKRMKRRNILGRNSNKKQKGAGPGSSCKRNTKKAEKGEHQDRSGHVFIRSEGRKVSQLYSNRRRTKGRSKKNTGNHPNPHPRSPNQIRSLFLQLTAISKFIPKLAKLKHPLREAQTRMETTKGTGWTTKPKKLSKGLKGN